MTRKYIGPLVLSACEAAEYATYALYCLFEEETDDVSPLLFCAAVKAFKCSVNNVLYLMEVAASSLEDGDEMRDQLELRHSVKLMYDMVEGFLDEYGTIRSSSTRSGKRLDCSRRSCVSALAGFYRLLRELGKEFLMYDTEASG